ncbi:NAD+ synthase [Metallosphaera tengchongensis]|uniref:NH(3)-dependent NAD(+) synthetase n=1 Tax=Metallosphaera tengchongensis TaxID=1532350 RepID=A0A6N0NVZ3_9CREN|nr:NAD+ synthase [Metallosphaera tengchongensis]QKR00387.1 NAD+ synthase [Metallosphaera tengchongensis]
MQKLIKDGLGSLDYARVTSVLVNRLREYIDKSGKKGGIVGVSGGIDSAVTATLLSMATQNFYFLVMPSSSTPQDDVEDALGLIKKLGGELKHRVIPIDDVVDKFSDKIESKDKVIVGNIKARTRMILLYAMAQKLDYLVIGTGDKSELMLGYFTKYGDGGVDVLPIGGLFKTQVRKLGEYLKVPESIVKKPSSPALWEGQTAEGELGVSYEVADPVLYLLEKGKKEEEIAVETQVDLSLVLRIKEMVKRSQHKRQPPEIFDIENLSA